MFLAKLQYVKAHYQYSQAFGLNSLILYKVKEPYVIIEASLRNCWRALSESFRDFTATFLPLYSPFITSVKIDKERRIMNIYQHKHF